MEWLFIVDLKVGLPESPRTTTSSYSPLVADETRLILSGYEGITDLDRETHFGQTWVAMPCEGAMPEAARGRPFPG